MKNIIRQYEEMLARGTIPCMELELSDGEMLTVWINYTHEGVEFNFFQEWEPTFNDEIVKVSEGHYLVPYDEFFPDSLDHYIEFIADNMQEGYISLEKWS